LLAQGLPQQAREQLLLVWQHYMDGLQPDQAGRVAVRLLERLAPSTDDPEAWTQLPETITVYRAGDEGFSWTTDRAVADYLARTEGLWPVSEATVAKADVLAYITGRGEAEILIRPENVHRLGH
jgi:hypothetical protein